MRKNEEEKVAEQLRKIKFLKQQQEILSGFYNSSQKQIKKLYGGRTSI